MSALLARLAAAASPTGRFIADHEALVPIARLAAWSALGGDHRRFAGRSVMIATRAQLPACLAVLELDGIARRLVLCTPDLPAYEVEHAARLAEADILLTDEAGVEVDGLASEQLATEPTARRVETDRTLGTEWVLFTSGSTGRPKLAVHTRESLLGPLDDRLAAPEHVWSTFYDVRRYGGLQILLRALAGGGSMVLSKAGEPVASFLARAGRAGVTHLSGTPSHWRRALMSDAIGRVAPDYVRLSGEAADQSVLDALARAFPRAEIAHAYASTEAGVEMRLVDGSLQVRSARAAARYLGEGAPSLTTADGFVDTGDLIERRGERCLFAGRRGGVINVGGLKVHPESVEAVVNMHPSVLMCRVSAKRSPITGALVSAEIVLDGEVDGDGRVKAEILDLCRAHLQSHEVPASLRVVASLPMAASGKLERLRA